MSQLDALTGQDDADRIKALEDRVARLELLYQNSHQSIPSDLYLRVRMGQGEPLMCKEELG